VIITAGLAWGLALGNEMSAAGHEARRVILGVGTFLLALPLVDDRVTRRRLTAALMVIGAALALWGLAQWVFSVGYTTSGDVGVRPGVELTTQGHGQLQGGMYAFPIAVILAWGALLSGHLRDVRTKLVLTLILVLNAICLLLTFERTLWVATSAACAILAMTYGPATRRLAVRWVGLAAVVAAMAAVAAPETARTSIDRLFSIARFSSDTSYTARVVESQAAIDTILQRPVTGSGFGATLTWGLTDVFGTQTTPFIHNGYLWLAWKLGIVAVMVIVALIASAALRRPNDAQDPTWHMVRRGSQAAVLALLLIAVTFPVFNALGITALMGLLVAVCVSCDSAEGLTR
jgi:O-antigen ligase